MNSSQLHFALILIFLELFEINVELKASLYADNLLYVSNLPVSVPAILDTLQSFSLISGYKLTLSKSELFPVNAAAKVYPLDNLPFKVAQHSFTSGGFGLPIELKISIKKILPLSYLELERILISGLFLIFL